MSMINAHVMRYHRPLIPEEGMGFSWGGFHPFRINDWKAAAKKIDAKLMNITGLDKIKPIANLNKSLWKDVDKIDRSVNIDFQKGKKWAQEHRKELQIAAAVAAAAVGGAWALGYLGTGGTAAAASAAGVETASGTAGLTATTAAAGAAGTATAAATGGGLLSTIGTTLGVIGSAATLLGKLKPQQPQETTIPTVIDYGGGGYGGSYGGGGWTGGGGGGLGPVFGGSETAPQEKIPDWVVPAAIAVAAIFLIKR